MNARALLAAVLLAAGCHAVPAAADLPGSHLRHPGPTPGCVTLREFSTAPYPLPKYQLEALWGVRGKGRVVAEDPNYVEVRYPRCGARGADLTDPAGRWVGVVYDKLDRMANEFMEYMRPAPGTVGS